VKPAGHTAISEKTRIIRDAPKSRVTGGFAMCGTVRFKKTGACL